MSRSQVEIMEKSYKKIERRNTKYRIDAINKSEHTESFLTSNKISEISKDGQLVRVKSN